MSPPLFQGHFCTFSHQKSAFFILSKMEVQAENGAKNH